MEVNPRLEAALSYASKGMSVIPARQDKKPFIAWQGYQKERADEDQIRQWWKKWPKANPAIVTGAISGVMVVDADSQKGIDTLDDTFIPESLLMPLCQTPKGGRHYYFKYKPGLSNGVRVLTDTDFRTDGGYVLAPPGNNGNGKAYEWIVELSIDETPPPEMPDMLYAVLQQGAALPASLSEHVLTNISSSTRGSQHSKPQQSITNRNKRNISFVEGNRDETLFHIANCLKKGGMNDNNILECLFFIGYNCEPPFPRQEIEAKIQSVLKRSENLNKNLTAEVREWIAATWGNITATEALQNATNATLGDRKKIRVILGRMVDKGVLERVPNKNGVYRKVDAQLESIDFLNAETESVDLSLPFNLDLYVELMPGNIILVAGEPNAGKTALLLNIIRQNMGRFNCHYFNSEMGGSELKKRLSNFDDIELDQWKFKAYERSSNFADVIKPGKGNVNIIDYLEMHDNFYEVGGRLAEIHNKLRGALAIVALQKNRGSDTGLGGFRSLEKPRLALAMEPGKLKIVKAKNWKSTDNPNGLSINFKLAAGCKLISQGPWSKE
jgi:hypothetical protein